MKVKSVNSLDWIALYEAFNRFAAEAKRHGLYAEKLEKIEEDMWERNPIPQPKQMEV